MNSNNPISNYSVGTPDTAQLPQYQPGNLPRQPSVTPVSTQSTLQSVPTTNATVTIDAAMFMQLIAAQNRNTSAPQQSVTFQNGDQYTGELKNGIPHGRGVMIYPPNDPRALKKYEGDFNNGMRHGNGSMTFANGSVYTGQFEMDHINGAGKMLYPNGRVYDGLFKVGKRHGLGTTVYPDGERFEGIYQNDSLNGQGSWQSANKTDRYTGNFVNSKFDGAGVLIIGVERSTGTFKQGVFWEGRKEANYLDPNPHERDSGQFANGKLVPRGGCNVM
jgi:hypothetical protein